MPAGSVSNIIMPAVLATVGLLVAAYPASAQKCQDSQQFRPWLADLKAEALAGGISARTWATAAPQLVFDPAIVRKDRAQGVFSQTFLQFSDRMVAQYRLDQGRANLRKLKSTFDRIETQFGVPGPVISAFWGLETDFGQVLGNDSTLKSLTSLAYDCRRPAKFRPQLIDALRLIENGDLQASQMIGAWAGELGQMQFLPTEYYHVSVDYDGDGKRDLLKSRADALASGANLMKSFGWRRGEPWLEEVKVPTRMDWAQADLAVEHPRSRWKTSGVRYADGRPIPGDGLKASLLLPMGHKGPAFLAYPNFRMFLEWNQSLVYSTTAAYFATRLAGAPKVSRGGKINSLSHQQIRQLQRILVARGFDVGKVDGIPGRRTRAAVKVVQQRLGLPADSYPTAELLARLQ